MFTAMEFNFMSSSSRTGKEAAGTAEEWPFLLIESSYSTTFKSGKILDRAAPEKNLIMLC